MTTPLEFAAIRGQIFRRTLAYTLAVAAILGISLLTIGLTNAVLADEEPHTTFIAKRPPVT